MILDIFPTDEAPFRDLENKKPFKRVFITASPMWAAEILPAHMLEGFSPEEIERQKQIEAAGGVIFGSDTPDDPEAQELRPEVDVALIRHPLMVIEEASDVVLAASEARLMIEYPLSVVVLTTITGQDGGITRGDILNAVHDVYLEIYAREDGASPPLHPDDRGGSLNRNETSGPFGIWGHSREDLWVEYINIYQVDGAYVVVPEIGS